jgi:hypothetical protein
MTAPYVCFVDDNSLEDSRRVERLVEAIRARGIQKTYEFYGRVDTVVRRPDLIEGLRSVGMRLLLLGLESHDPTALVAYNKKTTVEANREAIRICRTADVEVAAYLVVNPNFTRDDFRRLSDYVHDTGLTHPIFTILSPFPGTDFYADVKREIVADLGLLDFYHTVLPTTLPLDVFYDEFVALYSKAYSLTNFVRQVFHNRSVLTPRALLGAYRVKRGLQCLYSHHVREANEQ